MKLFNKNYTTKEVFKNIKYLDPECLPRKFHYRDNELETIAVNMSPIFYGSVPIHTVIIGGNATGKTTAIKKLFNDIQEPLPEVIPVYNNCRKHYTEYSVYKEIYNKVMNKKAPIRGSNSQKIFTDVMKKLNELLTSKGSLTDAEKPLVVSAILLALNENADIDQLLKADKINNDGKIRHDEGTHYTSKDNVLKVINSLFMNDLRAEFTKSKNNPKKLEILHDKISKLKFFDPSCGCGNFLVVTYEQLRLLEMDIIESLNPKGQVVFKSESRIRLSNFYGIEKQELPARICQVAMWLMEHKMDLDAENRFEIHRDNLPLKDSVNIKNTDALEIDWNEFIEPSDNVYILGNPPFISYQNQNDNQKKGLKHVFKGYKKTNQLDYVSAWFKKAAEYIQETNIQVGFISTNSICQGQQASILWKILMEDYNIHINFAHRTFVWDSEIKNKAVVYIVIIGFGFNELKKKYIYTYNHNSNIPILKSVGKINNYLYESDNIFLNVKRNKSICGAPDGFFGSMPIDHGNYLFTPDEKDTFLNEEPSAKKYMKELISAREHLHNKKKYCLWLEGINLSELKQMPLVMERVENVRSFRLASTRKETNELGKGMNAVLFGNIKLPTSDYIFVPLTTSENRDYIPFDMIKEDIVPNNTTAFIDTADLYYLGILISKMHMTWTRYVCGRLKGDYRYSLQIVYNNYPFPMKVTDSQKENIRRTTQEMLNIRNNYDESLADLYNPKYMPKELMKIHEKIDNLVDKCYSNNKFKNDDDRMKLLFKLYNEYTDNE